MEFLCTDSLQSHTRCPSSIPPTALTFSFVRFIVLGENFALLLDYVHLHLSCLSHSCVMFNSLEKSTTTLGDGADKVRHGSIDRFHPVHTPVPLTLFILFLVFVSIGIFVSIISENFRFVCDHQCQPANEVEQIFSFVIQKVRSIETNEVKQNNTTNKCARNI